MYIITRERSFTSSSSRALRVLVAFPMGRTKSLWDGWKLEAFCFSFFFFFSSLSYYCSVILLLPTY